MPDSLVNHCTLIKPQLPSLKPSNVSSKSTPSFTPRVKIKKFIPYFTLRIPKRVALRRFLRWTLLFSSILMEREPTGLIGVLIRVLYVSLHLVAVIHQGHAHGSDSVCCPVYRNPCWFIILTVENRLLRQAKYRQMPRPTNLRMRRTWYQFGYHHFSSTHCRGRPCPGLEGGYAKMGEMSLIALLYPGSI